MTFNLFSVPLPPRILLDVVALPCGSKTSCSQARVHPGFQRSVLGRAVKLSHRGMCTEAVARADIPLWLSPPDGHLHACRKPIMICLIKEDAMPQWGLTTASSWHMWLFYTIVVPSPKSHAAVS